MAPTALGESSPQILILTLTRACNLRCGFCPMELGSRHMDFDTARQALALYLSRLRGAAPRIRFFGGEPLLRLDLLRAVVREARRQAGPSRPPSFSFPTNGTLLGPEAAAFLREEPGIEAAVSRVRDAGLLASLPNVLVQVCIPPEGAGRAAEHVARLLQAGLRRLNVLPAYFVRWNEEQLAGLARSLRLAAGLLRRSVERGERVELRNASTWSPTPLFNHGMVVDVDGSIYPTNAVLCRPFTGLAETMRLGSVHAPRETDWARASRLSWGRLLSERLDPGIYESTRRVDELLTRFVREAADGPPPGGGHGMLV